MVHIRIDQRIDLPEKESVFGDERHLATTLRERDNRNLFPGALHS